MRLSELRDARVGQVKHARGGRYIHRPDSKNGPARKVVLTISACAFDVFERRGFRIGKLIVVIINSRKFDHPARNRRLMEISATAINM